ncbi:MAG: hypothetical protein CMP25_02055 [Rickettsiales bacterium]|nr:hypothetical protein [Rickettsiales bacterium]
MSTSNAIVLYLVIWWISLFLFLPLNIKSQKNIKKGNDPGAPEKPEIKKKFFITSIFSTFVWIIIFIIMKY